VGYENWVPYYRDHYPPAPDEIVRYAAPGQIVVEVSHNSFVEIVSQLGYPALLLFIALIGSIWFINWQVRRMLVPLGDRGHFLRQMSHGLDAGAVGFIIAGFFMAVAFNPFIWFQLAMSAALYAAAVHATSRGDAVAASRRRRPVAAPQGYRNRQIGPLGVR
jgi:O-antigen ligase